MLVNPLPPTVTTLSNNVIRTRVYNICKSYWVKVLSIYFSQLNLFMNDVPLYLSVIGYHNLLKPLYLVATLAADSNNDIHTRDQY